MSEVVPAPIRRILEEGAFCHVASLTPTGPHVTPMVFASAVITWSWSVVFSSSTSG